MRLLAAAVLVAVATALPGRIAAQDLSVPQPSRVFVPPRAHGPTLLSRWRLLWTGKRKFRLSDRVYAEVGAPGGRRIVPVKRVITL
jgi:hypothetical protein